MNTARLSRVTLILTLFLVTFGGFTRGSGSGYGCADRWPLCEDGLLGGLIPRWEYHMVIEWTHRWLAAIVGVLAIATAISAWRHFRDRKAVVIPAIAAVITIGIQAWVGRLVVKGDLDADLVSLHLVISMTVVALLTVVTVATLPPSEATYERSWTVKVGIAAAGSLLLLILGSLVHNRFFPGWPLMYNTLIPDLSTTTALVHFLHRIVAAVLLFYLLYLVSVANRIDLPKRESQLLKAATLLYVVNVGLGALHVVTMVGSPILVAIHLGVAGTVWALLVAGTTFPLLSRDRVPVLN